VKEQVLAVVHASSSGRLSDIGRPGIKVIVGVSLMAVFTLAVGVLAGGSLTDGGGRAAADVGILALAAFGGFLLFVLGLRRMEYFVLALLALRSCLDVSRLNGGEQTQTVANPSSLVALMFLVVGGAWLLARRSTGYRFPTSFLQRALILFGVAAALNVVGSADPAVSGLEFLRTLAALLMFFMVDRILEQTNRPDRILIAAFASAIVPVLIGLVGPYVGVHLVETKDRIERITSTFVGANAFSYYLVVLALMAAGVAFYAKPKVKWPLFAFSGVLTLTLVLTYTRTAWIAFAAGVLLLAAFAGKKVFIVMIAGMALAVLFIPGIGARFQELGSDNTYNEFRRDSLEWRFAYWTDIIPLANSNPVTGIGLKMTPELSGKLPHNDYLRSYVEMGLVGLVSFVVMLVAMIRTPWKALRTATDPLQRGILLGFLAIAVAIGVASLADNLINQVVVLWYVFAFAGCANWAARRVAEQRAAAIDSSLLPADMSA
jgi:O-antigen ligase